jgi:hypothetical protein
MSKTIKISCGVKFLNKDLAKKLGAKWDADNKNWYFQYDMDEFDNNPYLHTYYFKPYSISLLNVELTNDEKTNALKSISMKLTLGISNIRGNIHKYPK